MLQKFQRDARHMCTIICDAILSQREMSKWAIDKRKFLKELFRLQILILDENTHNNFLAQHSFNQKSRKIQVT